MKRFLCAAALTLLVSCREESATTTTQATTPALDTATTTVAAESPAAATPVGCAPAPNRHCPVDDGAAYTSFATYRQQLLAAVRQRDEAKLLALVDPGIRTSFGDAGGAADFRSSLQREGGALWRELEKVLLFGGSFRDGEEQSFWAPYVYSNWPESVDPFSTWRRSGRRSSFAHRLLSTRPRRRRCTGRFSSCCRPMLPLRTVSGCM